MYQLHYSTCTLLQCVCFVPLLHVFLLGNAQPSFTDLEIRWYKDIRYLSCLNGFQNIPNDVQVDWRKNGDIYSPDGSRVHGNGVLHFEHNLPEDEGRWTCSVGSTESPSYKLFVDPRVIGPVHAKYELHTDFIIPCNVELGTLTKQLITDYVVTWTRELIRDDEQSPSETNSVVPPFSPDQYNNMTQTISFPTGSHVLHTSNFSLSVYNFNISAPENVSFVKYICCVHVGSSECGETLINISFVPPSITKGLPLITVAHPGQNISLKVHVKSFPRPNIKWHDKNTTLDSQALSIRRRYQLFVERQGNQKLSVSTLTISNLIVEDSGPISVRTSMCEASNSLETLLIVLPSVNSVTISCTPNIETTMLTFTLPSGFPAIRTDTPGLTVQLALNFTAISASEQLHYQQILNLTYDEVLLAYIGHKNLLLLKTKRDIPEEVLQAVVNGTRFRVQAKLIVNNTHSEEWSKPCNSAVFASHTQCKMDEIKINLTLQSPPGTCSYLQMNTRQLAKEIQATFRETFLECKQLILFDPILNCFDNARSVFTATLRTHKPQLLKQKLAQNLKVGLRVVIGEELIPVMLETVNQPAPEPDKSERSVWMIIAIVALLLFGIVFVMCILLSVVLCVSIQRGDKRKSYPPKDIDDPRKLEEGVGNNESETERYVEMTSFSRQTSINPPALLNNITDDSSQLKDSPSNRETMSRSRETNTSGTELSTASEPSTSTRDSMEQHNKEADCSSLAGIQKKAYHQRKSNSDSKVKHTEIGKSLVLCVSPAHVTSRSPCTRHTPEHSNNLPLKDSNASNCNQTLKRLSLSQYVSHRRRFSDPSPSREQIRQLQLEASNEKCGDQNNE